MLKKAYSIIIICSLAMVSGCQNEKDFVEPISFEKVYNITDDLEEVIITTDLFSTTGMSAGDDFLFLLSNEKDTVVRVFNHSDMAYLGGFGTEGDGPREFFHPYQDGFRIFQGNVLSMMDRRSIRKLTPSKEETQLDRGISLNTIERHKIPGLMIPHWEGSFLGDSSIIGLNQTLNDYQLINYNYKSDTISYLFDYPPIKFTGNQIEKPITFYSKIKFSKDNKKLVMVYQKMPLLRIIDLESGNETYTKIGDTFVSDYLVDSKGYPVEDNTYFYFRVSVSNDYIFASYRKRQNKYFDDKPSETLYLSKNEIHVFDLEGNPKVKFIIDDWMTMFTALPDSKYLIFRHPEKERSLFRYKIPVL